MITKSPIVKINIFKSQPNIVDKIIAGAKIVIPAPNPLCIKNKIEAKVLVFLSNLCSKYS